ncbi:uncharacterized protein BT62DRAFT_1073570 [Guyanagaster necrorhizus]|uniref:ER membrane protein complex subunit 10 n=1 Tax=Guyanagaster necrorhizus TaxID=856835 RepID=A0A9P7VY14_9AGAR|nr:uncharacterized protein BT62DRAFT_1073570 [Guyanagaster necrorhizus MCA 3950]KAG7449034.1 hypothetical protein BT62DRAFT_1073570 [Guyanagaster necrorhizus MCA 3950]
MVFTPVLVAAVVVVHVAAALDVFHRGVHPDLDEQPFSLRGQLLLNDNTLAFTPSPSFSSDLFSFAQTLTELNLDNDRASYQVALDRSPSWEISSVKFCHLAQPFAEDLILYTTLVNPSTPYAINYFVSPIPQDGSCPETFWVDVSHAGPINTTITLRARHFPPLPELRTPPPLTPQGEPVQPPEEKSFFQKYWMYIAAVLIALTLSGGAPEEEGARRPA